MKIIIGQNDVIPAGEYELTDRNKLENAKGNIPFPASDRRILLEYDRIAGRILKDGKLLPPQTLWNIEKNRPIEQYSNPEIIDILRRAENTDTPGSNYQKARNEWEQRQHQENQSQINALIKELKELKEVTKQNAETASKEAKNSKMLALVAIVIALIGILVQVYLGIL